MKRRLFYSSIRNAFVATFLLAAINVTAQNQLDAGPDDTICPPACATLTATVASGMGGTALTLSDDQYSGVINLGFTFTYFGVNYTQCIIASNNHITFDLAGAGGYAPWPIGAAIPSPSNPVNSIMCPWQDLYPPAGGSIVYATLGTAPNRIFVVSYCSVALYSCTSLFYTGQIQLFETTNVIQTHVSVKPTCSWNGGYSIQGIQDASGTIAYAVPGRNWPSVWTAANDAYEWTPTGATSYFGTFIPFSPVILSATTGPIQWYNGTTLVGTGNTITVCPTATTQYVATVTGGCIGASSDTVNVVVSALASTASQVDASCGGVCDGSASVTVTSNNPPYTYSWTPSGGTGATASNLCAGTYTCTISSTVGCTDTQTFTITQPPPVTCTFTTGDETCAGNDGVATATGGGGTGPYTYAWSNGQTTQMATGLVSGTYTCIVTDANGCTGTQTVYVPHVVTPIASITASTYIVNFGQTSQLTGSGGGDIFQWSPGAGLSCTNCLNPIATITETSTYCLTLTDTTTNCSDSACVILEVPCSSGAFASLMPNAFSPNHDGNNDQFCIPPNTCIQSFLLKVYDRWGEKVFESTSMDKCWDGTFKGELLNTGVYVYYFDATLSNGQEFHQQGNISLLK